MIACPNRGPFPLLPFSILVDTHTPKEEGGKRKKEKKREEGKKRIVLKFHPSLFISTNSPCHSHSHSHRLHGLAPSKPYLPFPICLPPSANQHNNGNLPSNRKWFLQDLGHQGLNNLLAAYEDKGAKAVCTFGYSQGPGYEPILFQGITDVSPTPLNKMLGGWLL